MRPAGQSISIPTKLLATGVACAVALLVCGTAATVVVAADVTNTLQSPERSKLLARAYRSSSGPGEAFRDIGATARTLDSLLAPLGPPLPADSTVLASLFALNSDRSKSDVWNSAPMAALPAPIPDVGHRRLAIPLRADSLAGMDLAEFRAAARDPWLPLFRQWARGPRQPALWGYRPGLPGVSNIRDLPTRSLGPWRVLFAENEFASVLALHDGNSSLALQHARENVAAARHFVEQPIVIDALIGRVLLRRSLTVLASIATSAHDTTTANQARQLHAALQNYPGNFNLKLLLEQESNANSHATEDFVANQLVHPSLRVESLSTIALGGCHNLPELMFGFSEKRREAMHRAVANIRDIDRGAELGAKYQQYLEYALSNRTAPPTELPQSILGRSAILSAFAWIVPPGVRARAALCIEQGL